MIYMILLLLMTIFTALIAMAFYTLVERKFLGYIQHRKGPNKPSLIGIMVPVSDAFKLFCKDSILGTTQNYLLYVLAPMLMIILAFILWSLYPGMESYLTFKYGLFFFLCVTSMGIYATFLAGFASSSKWGLLGAIRGVAQTISYEVSMAFVVISFLLLFNTMNTSDLLQTTSMWPLFMAVPLFICWILSIVAETRRAPLDFAEGESELVSGFNTEYKSSLFALIFMAEYMNIIFMSMLSALIMKSNSSMMDLMMSTCMFSFIFIWLRATAPRIRYDILMSLLWKVMLPIVLVSMSCISLYSSLK